MYKNNSSNEQQCVYCVKKGRLLTIYLQKIMGECAIAWHTIKGTRVSLDIQQF